MSKQRWTLVALAIVVALGAAFWWLDFRAASSQTNTSSQVATASGGSKSGPSAEKLPLLSFHVVGDSPMASAAREEIEARLDASGKFGNVTSLAAAPAPGSGHLLLIGIDDAAATWTPVYSRAQVTAKVAYASNGDATLEDRPSVVSITSEQGQVVHVTGTLQVDDVTWGLTSRPAYQRHLGRQIGAQVADALVNGLASVPG